MTDDEPKPKRRSALRYALGGLVLLVLLGTGFVLLDRGGDSIIGDWCVKAKATLFGSQAIREQLRVGMTSEEVNRRIGFGTTKKWYDSQRPHPTFALADRSEDYPEYGFRVIYSGHGGEGWHKQTVLAIEDLP